MMTIAVIGGDVSVSAICRALAPYLNWMSIDDVRFVVRAQPVAATHSLASLYNLSDEQLEYHVRDGLSFMRLLGLGIEAPVPDATTIWLFREELAKAEVIRDVLDKLNHHLDAKTFIARGRKMIDASIIAVPKQRNDRDENDVIKAGKTPKGWKEKPAKNQQKNKDACWPKKHINADAKHKIIRCYRVTTASVQDSREFERAPRHDQHLAGCFADSAYRSAETEAELKRQGYRSRIHRCGARGAPLTEHQQKTNRNKSKTRARVEHVFGAQEMAQGGRQVRTIGIERAATKIGLQNLVYNIRRLVSLQRMTPA